MKRATPQPWGFESKADNYSRAIQHPVERSARNCALGLAVWRFGKLSLVSLFLLTVAALPLPAQVVHDIRAEWSETSNPNGHWSLHGPSGLLVHRADSFSVPSPTPQPVWNSTGEYNDLDVVLKVTPENDGPRPSWHAGDLMVHPNNEGAPTVIRWTSPFTGTVSIGGNVWYAQEEVTRNGWWGVAVNNVVVTDGTVGASDIYDRSTPFELALGSGGAAVLTGIPVQPGDEMELRLAKPASESFGTFMGFNFTVTEVQCATALSGLVGWWRGESNADDQLGLHHGTLQNGTSFASGKVGSAFSFDGVDDRVEIPDAPGLNPTTAVTLDAWVNPAALTRAYSAVVAKSDDLFSAARSYGMWISSDGRVHVEPSSTGSSYAFTEPSAVSLNTWTHVAAVITAGVGFQIYVNGVEQTITAVGSPTLSATSRPVSIGSSDTGRRDYWFTGLIDEVDIFDRALSQAEIQAIYNAGANGKCVNRPPVPLNPALGTVKNQPATMSANKLATDADGHALSYTVSATSAQGGTASLLGGNVTYTPPTDFTGTDEFTYTANDTFGPINGTVTVTVASSTAVSLNVVFGPVVVSGNFVVRFAAIPGRTYTMEWSADATGPWAKAVNIAAPTTDTGHGVGVFEFSEPVGGAGSRFYRTVYPSY